MPVERQWDGQTAVLIASGPSLTQADVDYCQGKARVLVVNDNYRLAPWADALYACDPTWWVAHKGVPDFAGQKWTQSLPAAQRWGLLHIEGDREPGLSRDPNLIHFGSNSGYQAINLAVHFGARRLLLLGYDMQRTGGRSHWFGDHPTGLNNHSDYVNFAHNFNTLPPGLEMAGVEVINCSRETALTCFPRRKLTDVLG